MFLERKMKHLMEKDDSYETIYAITEVWYIINKLEIESRNKIPIELLSFFAENFDRDIYNELDITEENIDKISDNAKLLLKIINIYINDSLNCQNGDYKEFANYYRDFELKDGETYQDLYDREKEKLRKLFMEMLDFLDVSYPSDDFDSLTSLIREHYPYYFDTMVSLKVTLADSKSTYIVELNDMEDIYESFSKNYKRHDEFMKQYYDEGKDFLDDDIEFIDE